MKDILGQECVKRGLLSFQGKIGAIVPDFSRTITVFSSLDPAFPPVPEMSNNRVYSPETFHNVIFKIVNLVAV